MRTNRSRVLWFVVVSACVAACSAHQPAPPAAPAPPATGARTTTSDDQAPAPDSERGTDGAPEMLALLRLREADGTACKQGDAVGCMQEARRGGFRVIATSCTQNEAWKPASPQSLTECLTGDTAACWRHAATLVRDRHYDFPHTTATAPIDGGLESTVPPSANEIRRREHARLRSACQRNEALACEKIHEMESQGIIPRPSFDERVNRCAEGVSNDCVLLAKNFLQGSSVPKSDACAVAYAWTACGPDSLHWCNELNVLYHPHSDVD